MSNQNTIRKLFNMHDCIAKHNKNGFRYTCVAICTEFVAAMQSVAIHR